MLNKKNPREAAIRLQETCCVSVTGELVSKKAGKNDKLLFSNATKYVHFLVSLYAVIIAGTSFKTYTDGRNTTSAV